MDFSGQSHKDLHWHVLGCLVVVELAVRESLLFASSLARRVGSRAKQRRRWVSLPSRRSFTHFHSWVMWRTLQWDGRQHAACLERRAETQCEHVMFYSTFTFTAGEIQCFSVWCMLDDSKANHWVLRSIHNSWN